MRCLRLLYQYDLPQLPVQRVPLMGTPMRPAGKVALGGMMGALSLMCLMRSFIPSTEYMMPAIAGALLLPVVVECGRRWGLMVYAVTAILALLFTPMLEPRVLYVAFFGYYPVLKAALEGQPLRWLEWVGKLAVFNGSVCLSYWLMLQFMGLDPAVFEIFGVNLPLMLLALGNLVFLMYDKLLSLLVTQYWRRLHGVFARLFKRR